MPKITIFLSTKDHDAFAKLAEREYRDLRAQAAYMIHQDLERRGLLSDDSFTCPHCGQKINKENNQS